MSTNIFYKFAINNCKSYLKQQSGNNDDDTIDAFLISSVLSIIFCKSKEEIIIDLSF